MCPRNKVTSAAVPNRKLAWAASLPPCYKAQSYGNPKTLHYQLHHNAASLFFCAFCSQQEGQRDLWSIRARYKTTVSLLASALFKLTDRKISKFAHKNFIFSSPPHNSGPSPKNFTFNLVERFPQ